MTEDAAKEVLYEERDSIAIITLNRPEKLNTLTEAVVQGLADGIDAATAYVCEDRVCDLPARSTKVFGEQLRKKPHPYPEG